MKVLFIILALILGAFAAKRLLVNYFEKRNNT